MCFAVVKLYDLVGKMSDGNKSEVLLLDATAPRVRSRDSVSLFQ